MISGSSGNIRVFTDADRDDFSNAHSFSFHHPPEIVPETTSEKAKTKTK